MSPKSWGAREFLNFCPPQSGAPSSVPKMEGFLYCTLLVGYFGVGETPVSISRIHTAYIGFRMNPPFGWYLSEMFGEK